ncbi:MAG TPA: acyl-CoA dehydrogenase family protein, partial [Acidimicrobiales bacterium]|nr:acyl-CoA dehydrogenase family protein [Acidimicrobiales bacterium]
VGAATVGAPARAPGDDPEANPMSILLHPGRLDRPYPDERSREVMATTVAWFEARGKGRLKADDHAAVWYQDFLDFQAAEGIFATMCTPAGLGADDSRWDTWRICEFAEILGFYGLQYWYTWQVTVLGLGPLWMSKNDALRERTAALLADGAIFAFGLSEKDHGADLYSTDMVLEPQDDGTYRANGSKYYIGNGNQAALVSVFGKLPDGNPVAFAVSSQHEAYELVKNVVHSQNYVSEFRLHDYPVTEDDIIAVGGDAWNAGLNTVNIGKYNLGWASIGICTHAMYEAVTHAHNRILYGHPVTDFPHVRQLHRRVLPPGGHEGRGAAGGRLLPLGLARRPSLPVVQPRGEDEGHDPGRGRHQPPVGRDRGQGVREGHVLRGRGTRHPRPAQARGHGPREHLAHREVHGELLRGARRRARRAPAGRRRQRRLPLRPGPHRRAVAGALR